MQTMEKKEARLGLRLNDEQKKRIEKAAAMLGQTVSSFASSELLRRSDEILEQHEQRRLSNAARDEFLALLEADIEPTEAAKKAAAEFSQGRRIGSDYYFEL